jgi:hypothetical protein
MKDGASHIVHRAEHIEVPALQVKRCGLLGEEAFGENVDYTAGISETE